ncbi:MAG: glycosyltransferase family 4 protein [Chloroflexota bacterium]
MHIQRKPQTQPSESSFQDGAVGLRSRPLRVLLVSSLFPPTVVGGAETVVSDLAIELRTLGFTVTVLTTQPTGGISREVLPHGIEVIRVSPYQFYWPWGDARPSLPARVAWHVLDTWNILNLHRLRFLSTFDVIHTHNLSALSPAVWMKARRKANVVIHTAHDYYLLCPRATLLRSSDRVCTDAPVPCRIYRSAHLLQLRQIDALTAPTMHVLQRHELEGASVRVKRVIHNGVALPPLTAARKSNHEGFNLLFLGQVSRHKGVLTAIDAVRFSRADDVQLDIAGRGELEESVREIAASDSRIRYHGFVDGREKEKLLSHADALIVPSIWEEPAPLSILEALVRGLPVIASRIGGIPELVRHDVDGFLATPGSSDEFAQAIGWVRLHQDRMRTSVASRRHGFSKQRMANDFARLYLELLGTTRRGL